MDFPLVLASIVAAFIWTQMQRSEVPEELLNDFNKMLNETSEMCDASIKSVLNIMSYETNQKLKSIHDLKKYFNTYRNGSRPMNKKGICKAGSLEDAEKTSSNLEECFQMIEIEQKLEIIFEDVVRNWKEISSLKKEFPVIIEATCSGDEHEDACKVQVLHTAKSQVANLLAEASINVKIMNEIIGAYQKLALICWKSI